LSFYKTSWNHDFLGIQLAVVQKWSNNKQRPWTWPPTQRQNSTVRYLAPRGVFIKRVVGAYIKLVFMCI
jgi:hypothetical protein